MQPTQTAQQFARTRAPRIQVHRAVMPTPFFHTPPPPPPPPSLFSVLSVAGRVGEREWPQNRARQYAALRLSPLALAHKHARTNTHPSHARSHLRPSVRPRSVRARRVGLSHDAAAVSPLAKWWLGLSSHWKGEGAIDVAANRTLPRSAPAPASRQSQPWVGNTSGRDRVRTRTIKIFQVPIRTVINRSEECESKLDWG